MDARAVTRWCVPAAATRVADTLAASVGANRTTMVQDLPGRSGLDRQASPVTVRTSGPVSRVVSRPVAARPVLVSVKVRVTATPSATRPKSCAAGVKLSAALEGVGVGLAGFACLAATVDPAATIRITASIAVPAATSRVRPLTVHPPGRFRN